MHPHILSIDGISRTTFRSLFVFLVLVVACSSLFLLLALLEHQVPENSRELNESIELTAGIITTIMAVAALVTLLNTRSAAARKAIENQNLRASEAEFRNLVSAVPVLTRVTNQDGKANFFSTPWLIFTGRSMEHALGDAWLQSVHEDDRSRVAQALSEHLQTRTPASIEYRLRRNDGVFRWILDRCAPHIDSNNQFRGSISSGIDVTERHEKDARIREVNEALENAVEGISTLDTHLRFVSINSAFASAIGSTPDALIGKPLDQTIFPDDRHLLYQALNVLKEHGKAECELRGIHADGSHYLQRITFVIRRSPHGEALGSHCFMKDITDHRFAESSATEQSTRFASLAAIAPVGIFHTDPDGNCLYVNDHWCRIADMKPQDALGSGWTKAVHPEDLGRLFKEWNDAVLSGGEFRSEYRFKNKSGRILNLIGASNPVRDASQKITGYVGFVTDITEAKKSRDDLYNALQLQLEMLEREKSLRRELDHRVRNNLASLIGLVGLYEKTDRTTDDLARTLRGQISAMKQVHETISRAGGGDVEIQTLLHTLHHSLIPEDAINRVTLQGPSLLISASQAAVLAMILQELVTNSLKHGALTSPTGTINVLWTLRNPSTNTSHSSTLELDWFERGNQNHSNINPPGSGVGLALIQGFAKTDLCGSVNFEKGEQHWRCSLVAELSGSHRPV